MDFDHEVIALHIQDGADFPQCAECGFPVGRDMQAVTGYAHLDDPERDPWRLFTYEEILADPEKSAAVAELLREMMGFDMVEVTGSTWTHVLLPSAPGFRVRVGGEWPVGST